MPASTSVRTQDAVMRLRAKHHSIVMVNSGPTALAWLISGFSSTGYAIYCNATPHGYVLDCGPAEDVSFGVEFRPDKDAIRATAEHVCHWLNTLARDVAFGMVVEDVLTLGDGRVLEGWRSESEIDGRGHLILTVTPAFV